jgi:hypothetical protein
LNHRLLLGLATLMLVSCREREAENQPIDSANPIELAAREANLVEDPNDSPPIGLYERRHNSGRDALCIVPAGVGAYRFGLIASFGSELMCQGRGSLTQDGTKLTFKFIDAQCEVEAVYDGRSVRMPGAVPAGCAEICGPRASISGVAISRVGWTQDEAMTLHSRLESDRGQPLCRR